jgi:DNA-binding NtrC family response regulator
LYFRLSVIHVELPPLRERREDIPQLVHHFLREVAERRQMQLAISVDAMAALVAHQWPGNVRELRNVVERAASLCEGPTITRTDLQFGRDGNRMMPARRVGGDAVAPAAGGEGGGALPGGFELVPGLEFKEAKQRVVDAFERAYLTDLLKRHSGNITRAAGEAGLTRYHLRELLKRHNLVGGTSE